ncbi:hypothetical protein ENUP19_0388G0011 [Entamoeba nuttalli]|uniref:Macro domain-containing protein n=1 Tax=Entamoeba nuttalli TaxID=412467 RepID=A0ABQ0DZQ2_9EUKA
MSIRSEKVRKQEWVKRITGETESEFRVDKENWIYQKPSLYSTPEMVIVNKITKEEFSCGCLEMIPLKDLRKCQHQSTQGITFEIILREDDESIDHVNVATMQAMKEYNNSVFLVASNFNAVESVSETIEPNEHNFTTNYIYDGTQGPIASLGAPAAALQRTIFPFYNKTTKPKEWEQSQEKQIEILGELNSIYHVINGYPILEKDVKEPSEKDEEKYLSVFHSNVEVTYIYGRNEMTLIPKQMRNRIDQVFAAAINIGQGCSGYENYELVNRKPKVLSYALDCGYETCYLVAIKNHRTTIVLTLLGGGVFGNSYTDICKSIIKIHKRYSLGNNGELRRVVLPLFSKGGNGIIEILIPLLQQEKISYKIVHYQKNQLVKTTY